ncbi:hypothetical protein JB92DRAFT_2831520 [Gautieria morchelliformis]|nr:hypothetical protein JB92DRAFT_2839135 [Gautieria morchelliformis]KAF8510636.1 hypothetical protein JB92DRAFT_2831520 [Gautieria morchelliformis]
MSSSKHSIQLLLSFACVLTSFFRSGGLAATQNVLPFQRTYPDCESDVDMDQTRRAVAHRPTHADGRLYTDYELPEAFEKSYIELPQCPCATQETNPATTHYYHIWVVQSGPYQVCLTDLICVNPSLPSQHYARRPDDQLGPGLPNFDRCSLLTRNSNGKNRRYTSKSTNMHGDVTPPPPYRSARNNRRGFGGITKVTGSSASKSGIKKHATLHPASNDDLFVVTPEPCSPSSIASSQLTLSQLPIPSVGTSRSPSRVTCTSSESLSTLPHLPLPSTTSTAPTTIGPTPPKSEMPPSNQLELQTPSDSQTSTCYDNSFDIQTTPRSQQNLQLYEAVTVMPGDRRVGDTACLWEPPEANQVYVYNRHVPALCDNSLTRAFDCLSSGIGLSSETFWQALDQCNCGLYFTKETLHYLHGPQCPLWPYVDIPDRPAP